MAQTKDFRPIEDYPPVLQARHVKNLSNNKHHG